MNFSTRAASTNGTQDALEVFCGFPLSAPYGLMPRVLLYPLLWAAFFSRTSLIITMIWTSVTSIHLSAMASHHSPSVLDTDIFPAYSTTILGLLFAPTYIMLARPLKGAGQADRLAACLWMVLLWTGVVSFTASMRYQPPSPLCLDAHGRNVSSWAQLSMCTFQCHNISTYHAMRSGQHATLIQIPGSYYTGPGKTDHWVIAGTILVVPFMLAGFWMATKSSMLEYTTDKIRTKRLKKTKEEYAKGFLIPVKVSFSGFIFVVWFMEDAIKHIPETEHRDTISQWGPQVGFAVALMAWLMRKLLCKVVKDDNPNVTEYQRKRNLAAMPPLTQREDLETGRTGPPRPEAAHVEEPTVVDLEPSHGGCPETPPSDPPSPVGAQEHVTVVGDGSTEQQSRGT
jgi:hypothetical protein